MAEITRQIVIDRGHFSGTHVATEDTSRQEREEGGDSSSLNRQPTTIQGEHSEEELSVFIRNPIYSLRCRDCIRNAGDIDDYQPARHGGLWSQV